MIFGQSNDFLPRTLDKLARYPLIISAEDVARREAEFRETQRNRVNITSELTFTAWKITYQRRLIGECDCMLFLMIMICFFCV